MVDSKIDSTRFLFLHFLILTKIQKFYYLPFYNYLELNYHDFIVMNFLLIIFKK